MRLPSRRTVLLFTAQVRRCAHRPEWLGRTAPFTQAGVMGSTEEEYVLGNTAPLAAQCRTMELRLGNGGWTFPSEIEMAAEQ
ncbi:unnamed protein product [Stenotrophomonas maltophilia]|nr:unnamed protein product [Stenotrophomonas maltophilia]